MPTQTINVKKKIIPIEESELQTIDVNNLVLKKKDKKQAKREAAAAAEAAALRAEEKLEGERLEYLAKRRVEAMNESHSAQQVEQSVTLCERVQVSILHDV
jgi:hypothetical protein